LSGVDILERPGDLPTCVTWHQQDLNEQLSEFRTPFDVVICSEVIEHLENRSILHTSRPCFEWTYCEFVGRRDLAILCSIITRTMDGCL
jgi:hypothetical protein